MKKTSKKLSIIIVIAMLLAISSVLTLTACNGGATVAVRSVALDTENETLTIGDTYQLTATVSPDNASTKTVKWKTSDKKIATVSDKGLVTAVALGTATITVSTIAGGKTATCEITVKEFVGVESVSLNAENGTLTVGDTYQLIETVLPADATNKAVTWSSDTESVATVSEEGLIEAISKGVAVITVTTVDGEKTAEYTLSVKIPGETRKNAIEISLDTPETMSAMGNEEGYYDTRGKWYCFTPEETDWYTIKATKGSIESVVYLFDSLTESYITYNYYGSINNRFRLRDKLTAEKTYYFFVGLDSRQAGSVSFELFKSGELDEIIQQMPTDDAEYLKAVIEIRDFAKSGNYTAMNILRTMDLERITTLAENGSAEAVSMLYEIYQRGNQAAQEALQNLDVIESLKSQAFDGSTDAVYALYCLVRHNKQDALTALITLSSGGSIDATETLNLLANNHTYATPELIIALRELDVESLIIQAENGSIDAITALYALAYWDNEDAEAALKKLDVKALAILAESGILKAIYTLEELVSWWNNKKAESALKNLDTTALATLSLIQFADMKDAIELLAEYGNQRALTILITLAENGLSDAIDILQSLAYSEIQGAFTALVNLAENNSVDAVSALNNLATWGNQDAKDVLKRLDISEILLQFNDDLIDIVYLLRDLADWGNAYALNPLITLAESDESDAVYALFELASSDNQEALEALLAFAENGSANAVNAVNTLAGYGNEDAIAVIKNLDVTSLIAQASDGSFSAINALCNIIRRKGNQNALPALIALAEDGLIDAAAGLINLDGNNSEIRNAIQNLNVTKIILQTTGDSFTSISVLSVLCYVGNQNALTALVNLAEDGSLYAVKELTDFAEYNSDIENAVQNLDATKIALKAAGGSKEAMDALWNLCYLDNQNALMALVNLAEDGSIDAAKALIGLFGYGSDIENAVRNLDVTKIALKTTGGWDEAMDVLHDLTRRDNQDALTALVNLAESGSLDAVNALHTSNGNNQNIENAFKNLDITEFIRQASSGSPEAIEALDRIAYWGNQDAEYVLENLDTDIFVAVATENTEAIVEALEILIRFKNPNAMSALITLAENLCYEAILSLTTYAQYGNQAAKDMLDNLDMAALVALAESGSYNAIAIIFTLAYLDVSQDAAEALENLDIIGLLKDLAEDGSTDAVMMLLGLSYEGYEYEALSAIQTLDVTKIILQVESGSEEAEAMLEWLAIYGNRGAMDYFGW